MVRMPQQRIQEFKGGVAYDGRMFILITHFMRTCKLILRLLGMDKYKNTDFMTQYNYTCPYRISRLRFIGKWQTNESLLDGLSA